jgi:hydrogenase-4 component E
MSAVAAPSVYSGGASVIAVGVLLAEFGMFRQTLLRDQVRLYAAQSAALSALAILVAAARHLPDLYVLAALSAGLKVVIVPIVLRRLLRGVGPGGPARNGAAGNAGARDGKARDGTAGDGAAGDGTAVPGWTEIAGSGSLSVASTVLLAIAVAAFGFFCAGALGIRSPVLPPTALAMSVSVVLVAFVLMIMRRDVASQAIGFLSLENGISLAALVVAAGLPLILEVAFLFDLLVAVVVLELLIRVHHARADSLSTADLTRLRG